MKRFGKVCAKHPAARGERYYKAKKQGGSSSVCVECSKERARQPDKRRISRRAKWRKNGVDPDEAERMLARHDGHCAICRTANPGRRVGWHVDHDHTDKRVRGILCTNCNRGLGHFKDSMKLLERATLYLLS